MATTQKKKLKFKSVKKIKDNLKKDKKPRRKNKKKVFHKSCVEISGKLAEKQYPFLSTRCGQRG